MNKQDIINLIKKDEWMVKVLNAVREINLPDSWVGAGFVRNKVWDVLHGYNERTPLADVDVIYFDPSNVSEDREKELEAQLANILPDVPWSVKNHARIHLVSNDDPFISCEDGVAHWAETATAVAVKITSNDEVALLAPYGIEDLVNLIVRMGPKFKQGAEVFKSRYKKKNWQSKWPNLKIIE